MITKVTQKQQKKLMELRETYVQNMVDYTEIDEEKLRKDIHWLYGLEKQKRPEVIIVDDWKQQIVLSDNLNNSGKIEIPVKERGPNIGPKLIRNFSEKKRRYYKQVSKKLRSELVIDIWHNVSSFVIDRTGKAQAGNLEGTILRQIGRDMVQEFENTNRTRLTTYGNLMKMGRGYQNDDSRSMITHRGPKVWLEWNTTYEEKYIRDKNVILEFLPFFGLPWDSAGLAFYESLGMVAKKKSKEYRILMRYRDLLFNGVFSILTFENVAIVTRKPEKLVLSKQGRLHSVEQPAVQWASSYNQYFIEGHGFDKMLWKDLRDGKIGVADILQIEDLEQSG